MTRSSSDSKAAKSDETSRARTPSVSGETLGMRSQSGEGELDTGEDDFLRALARIPSAPPPRVELEKGQLVGDYRIGDKLGQGGMGVVYAAVDQKLGREVALKLLPEDIGSERKKRFFREARSASAVSHPNIATVFAVGEDSGSIFIVMERVVGETLRARLESAGGKLDESEALRVAREVASALVKAHAAGIVHRDLKPENVMISEDGRIKILDFGLAKLRDTEGSKASDEVSELATREGRILGTPSYMSPEQAKGRSVDARSDLFSLGVILYELLSGRRPFSGTTTMETLIAIDRDDYAPLSKIRPGTDTALERLLARCLAKQPEQRFANAAALIEAIDELPRARRQGRLRVAGLVLFSLLVLGLASFGIARLRAPMAHAPESAAEVVKPEAPRTPASLAVEAPPVPVPVPAPSARSAPESPSAAPRVRPKPRLAEPRPDPLSDQK